VTSIIVYQNRRHYAAIETEKLGYGGASYIRELFSCDNRTILHGRFRQRPI